LTSASIVRGLLRRPPYRIDQLADGAALGAALGPALPDGAGVAPGVSLGAPLAFGAALTPGEAPGEFGVGHSCSWFVRPPHCSQNC
jgi:hypothetical protein